MCVLVGDALNGIFAGSRLLYDFGVLLAPAGEMLMLVCDSSTTRISLSLAFYSVFDANGDSFLTTSVFLPAVLSTIFFSPLGIS